MRRGVDDLRGFYATALGAVVRDAVGRRLQAAWGDAAGQDVLLWGYATPFAEGLTGARRVVAAMPQGQGAEPWPAGVRNRACLVPEDGLPLPNALFDRVLVAHLLEESDAPEAVMVEAARVMTAAGRVVLVAAARDGLWSRAESTPFGHGRPYSRRQLERAVRAAGLEPTAWARALHTPPSPLFAGAADLLEVAGSRLVPALSGLVMLEASKRTFAPAADRAPARVRAGRRPALAPAPVASLGGVGVVRHR